MRKFNFFKYLLAFLLLIGSTSTIKGPILMAQDETVNDFEDFDDFDDFSDANIQTIDLEDEFGSDADLARINLEEEQTLRTDLQGNQIDLDNQLYSTALDQSQEVQKFQKDLSNEAVYDSFELEQLDKKAEINGDLSPEEYMRREELIDKEIQRANDKANLSDRQRQQNLNMLYNYTIQETDDQNYLNTLEENNRILRGD